MYSFGVALLQWYFLIHFYGCKLVLPKLFSKVLDRLLLNIHMHLLAGLGRYIRRRKPKVGVALDPNVGCSNRKCGRLCFDIDNDLRGELEIFLLYLRKLSRTMRLVYYASSKEVLQHRVNPSFQTTKLKGLCTEIVAFNR